MAMFTARRLALLLLPIACAPLIMAAGGGPIGIETGVAFQDVNENGVPDPGEPGLIGWEIHVFDTAIKALVQSTLTIASNPGPPPTPDGFYTFSLSPGKLHDLRGAAGGVDADRPAVRPTAARGDAG